MTLAFARTGNPNHSALPEWPAFNPDGISTMFFDDECRVRHNHDREARLLHEQGQTR
jgi:para-nitrobenzyl esterase